MCSGADICVEASSIPTAFGMIYIHYFKSNIQMEASVCVLSVLNVGYCHDVDFDVLYEEKFNKELHLS